MNPQELPWLIAGHGQRSLKWSLKDPFESSGVALANSWVWSKILEDPGKCVEILERILKGRLSDQDSCRNWAKSSENLGESHSVGGSLENPSHFRRSFEGPFYNWQNFAKQPQRIPQGSIRIYARISLFSQYLRISQDPVRIPLLFQDP